MSFAFFPSFPFFLGLTELQWTLKLCLSSDSPQIVHLFSQVNSPQILPVIFRDAKYLGILLM